MISYIFGALRQNMTRQQIEFNALTAAFAGMVTWMFGDWDIAVIVLIAFLFLDYGTGLMRACITHKLSSDIGFKGITRKVTILVVLIVAVLLDRLINDGTWVFRTLVCYFYISNEGISLIENCASLGVPIPTKIKDILEQLREGNKKDSTKKEEV